ncbi:hypothetical protein Tco_1319444 [Tanacetum coccineum]
MQSFRAQFLRSLMNDGKLWGLNLVKTERIGIVKICIHRWDIFKKSHGDLHNLHNKDIVVEDSVKFAGTHHSIDRSKVPDLELEEYNNDHNEHRSRKYHTILVHSVGVLVGKILGIVERIRSQKIDTNLTNSIDKITTALLARTRITIVVIRRLTAPGTLIW